MTETKKITGYLPDENPSFVKLVLFAFQQIVVMFPATVLVALLTGFHVSTTIFASGLATLCFILITKKKIPLYYGSSFSYITAIVSITGAEYGVPADDSLISAAQFGIILSGLISIAVGLLVRKISMEKIEKFLPATVTGSIALIIGLSLAKPALDNIVDVARTLNATEENFRLAQGLSWAVALVTLFATVFFSVYLKKGTWSQIPILLGLLLGYAFALLLDFESDFNFIDFSLGNKDSFFSLPHFTLPRPSWEAMLAIMPIAVATIPESTAHLYQLDIYVNKLAEEKGSDKKYRIADRLGLNLIGDGLGDMISGAVGGPAGTNYGENISTMAITRNYSVGVLIAASVITMLLSFVTPLSAAVYSIPPAVIGGLSIYLFGVIGAQGITIMIDKKVSLFDAKNLSIIASILILGLGGSVLGGIPFFGMNLPPIAAAALFGILLNLIYQVVDMIKTMPVPKKSATSAVVVAVYSIIFGILYLLANILKGNLYIGIIAFAVYGSFIGLGIAILKLIKRGNYKERAFLLTLFVLYSILAISKVFIFFIPFESLGLASLTELKYTAFLLEEVFVLVPIIFCTRYLVKARRGE